MGLFGTILEKLGLSKSTAQAAPQPAPSAPAPMASQPAAPPPPRAMAAVDVVAKLEGLARREQRKTQLENLHCGSPETPPVLKQSYCPEGTGHRIEMPTEKMADSAQMNMWLHKTVLKKLAENGGNIPKDLLS